LAFSEFAVPFGLALGVVGCQASFAAPRFGGNDIAARLLESGHVAAVVQPHENLPGADHIASAYRQVNDAPAHLWRQVGAPPGLDSAGFRVCDGRFHAPAFGPNDGDFGRLRREHGDAQRVDTADDQPDDQEPQHPLAHGARVASGAGVDFPRGRQRARPEMRAADVPFDSPRQLDLATLAALALR